MMLRTLLVSALLGLAVSGCARESDSSPGRSEVNQALAGNAPPCELVWVEGERLPLSYRGCDERGFLEAATLWECQDGDRIAIYAERMYARLGGRVVAVEGAIADDPAYAEFWHDCMG